MLRLLVFFVSLFASGGLPNAFAVGGIDDYPEFHYRKSTATKADYRLFYDFTKEILDGEPEYRKYVELEDPGDFEDFYKTELASQAVPLENKVHLELNPLSGAYYFFLRKEDEEPVGLIKIKSQIDTGILDLSTIFKPKSPKGAGTKALQLLKPHIDLHLGKKLRVCIEEEGEEEEPSSFSFGNDTVYHVMANIEYGNVPSLIVHARLGMAPLFDQRGQKEGHPVHWISLVYPPLNHAFYKEKWPTLYEKFIAPSNAKMEKAKPLLDDVASHDSERRKDALEKLENLSKAITLNEDK